MSLTRLAPLSALLGIAGVLTGLWLDNFPDGTFDDAAVAHWFDVHGTTQWIVSGAGIALGGTVLLIFAAVITERVRDAGAGPVATTLTQVSATGWALLTMVGGAIWLAAPVAVNFFDVVPTAGLMALAGLAYAVLVSVCAFSAAVLAATLTTVSRNTGLLPRWLTRLGYPAAVLMLTNVVLPMAVITLFFVAATICLVRSTAVDQALPARAAAALS